MVFQLFRLLERALKFLFNFDLCQSLATLDSIYFLLQSCNHGVFVFYYLLEMVELVLPVCNCQFCHLKFFLQLMYLIFEGCKIYSKAIFDDGRPFDDVILPIGTPVADLYLELPV